MLPEDEMPDKWYNIQADIPVPPPLNPATREPMDAKDMEPIFPKELLRQEMSTQRWIEIPEEVREIYSIWRPTPLYRAVNLEKISENTCKNLLQVGRCKSSRKPQTKYICCTGLLQCKRGGREIDHGNRSRTVGFCSCLCLSLLRFGLHSIYGEMQL